MWLSVKKSGSLSGTKTYNGTPKFSTGVIPYFWVCLPFFAIGAEKVAKTVLLLSGWWILRRRHSRWSTSTCAWGALLVCGHLEPRGDCHSSCCSSKSKTKNKSVKEILNKNNSFFRTNCPRLTKRTGHYAWLVALILGVIALAIILLVIGLVALWVLVALSRIIIVLIVLMTIVGSAIAAIVSVALMVVMIFVTTMLLVA